MLVTVLARIVGGGFFSNMRKLENMIKKIIFILS